MWDFHTILSTNPKNLGDCKNKQIKGLLDLKVMRKSKFPRFPCFSVLRTFFQTHYLLSPMKRFKECAVSRSAVRVRTRWDQLWIHLRLAMKFWLVSTLRLLNWSGKKASLCQTLPSKISWKTAPTTTKLHLSLETCDVFPMLPFSSRKTDFSYLDFCKQSWSSRTLPPKSPLTNQIATL